MIGRYVRRRVVLRGVHPNGTVIEVCEVEGFGFDYIVMAPSGGVTQYAGCYRKAVSSARAAAVQEAGQAGRFKWAKEAQPWQ